MKMHFGTLIISFAVLVLTACSPVSKEPRQENIATQGDKTVFNDGHVSFQLPGSFISEPDSLKKLNEGDSNYLCSFLYKKEGEEEYYLRLMRRELKEPIPAEVLYITTLNICFESSSKGIWTIKAFGVYDHNKTRYRYFAIETDAGFSEDYFFIKSDSSKIIYNLIIDSYKEYGATADSMITEIAHSFQFVE